jgi:hypothetical protein
MPRKKRRRPATTAPAVQATAGWRWRSFPVFFAFVFGAFLMGLVNGTTNVVGFVFFYAVLFGVAFGAAHFVTRRWAERRLRSRQAAAAPPPTAEARRAASAPSAEAEQEIDESPRLAEGAQTSAPRQRTRRRAPRRR